jgi:Icc-related predicted phosphoesterase
VRDIGKGMRILALGDPHGKLPKNLDKIISKNKIELIFCTGDVPPVPNAFRKGKINNFPKEFLKKADNLFGEIVRKICSYKIPVLILRGNMYLSSRSTIITKKIYTRYENLIYKKTGKVRINGFNFVLFDMSFEEHSHKNVTKRKLASNKLRTNKLAKLLNENKEAILLSHAPPYGYLDKTYSGKHIGSKILLKAIKKNKPKLALSGHVHEAKGKAKIGKTIVYNLGYHGDYAVVDTEKNKLLESNFLK